jgi:hypothetical protein
MSRLVARWRLNGLEKSKIADRERVRIAPAAYCDYQVLCRSWNEKGKLHTACMGLATVPIMESRSSYVGAMRIDLASRQTWNVCEVDT